MIKVKGTVRPRSVFIIAAVANVARAWAFPFDVTITSVRDSKHMEGSKHDSGDAVDVRTKNFPSLQNKQAFVHNVLARLGAGYQGFLEDVGGVNEHAHFEYDPK